MQSARRSDLSALIKFFSNALYLTEPSPAETFLPPCTASLVSTAILD
ncbi:hypothetical protein AWB69_05606 [Caballeronia udeis]|uniref:Uncharacterized protein n=1 Tax=Caballeronia udeis TaxID=1232866 RepID=A0A158IAA5_9BURK|nr:hypothetical protein AWB69_05606 [Caballeronia udeis]